MGQTKKKTKYQTEIQRDETKKKKELIKIADKQRQRDE